MYMKSFSFGTKGVFFSIVMKYSKSDPSLSFRPCVGLVAAPPEDQSWFCVKCAGKKKDKKTKKRKRKAH